ncbi:hypothetical protein [Cupriavidus agavae]|nr:hypothetical protein [Cupriavidus agavae]
MQVHIRCRTTVSLQRLVPAFPMTVTAAAGELTLTRRGFTRVLQGGQRIHVPAFEQVDLLLAGGLFRPAGCVLSLGDEAAASAGMDTGLQQLRAVISGTIFQNPQESWNAHLVAQMLQTTPGRVRTALFAQGVAFTQLCRTQRLMRALFDAFLLDVSVADLKKRVGWADDKDLEAPFHDWFGVSLDTVARLREAAL